MLKNGQISADKVSLWDIQRALGASTTSLVTLCRHSGINRFSRHKPYNFGGVLPEGLYGTGGTSDGLLKVNNFGMQPGTLITPSPYNPGITVPQSGAWTQWRPPSGSREDDQPCRMGDFRGYDIYAKSYIESIEIYGDCGTSLIPVLGGRTGARLTLRTDGRGSSVLPSEFTYNNPAGGMTSLGDMRLTLVVIASGPRGNWGHSLLAVQSAQTLGMCEATMKLNGGAATDMTVELDLSGVSGEEAAAFTGGNPFCMALCLSPDITEHCLNATPQYLVKSGTMGNAMLLSHGTDAPVELLLPMVNADVWGQYPSGRFIHNGSDFAANQNQTYRFDVPCSLYSSLSKTTARFATVGGKNGVVVDLGGYIGVTMDTAAIDAQYTQPGNPYGQIGVEINVEAMGYKGTSATACDSNCLSWYIVGKEGVESGREFIFDGGAASFRPQYDGPQLGDNFCANPPKDYGINLCGCPWTDGGLFLELSGEVTRAEIDVMIALVGIPTADSAIAKYAPVIRKASSTSVIEQDRAWAGTVRK